MFIGTRDGEKPTNVIRATRSDDGHIREYQSMLFTQCCRLRDGLIYIRNVRDIFRNKRDILQFQRRNELGHDGNFVYLVGDTE